MMRNNFTVINFTTNVCKYIIMRAHSIRDVSPFCSTFLYHRIPASLRLSPNLRSFVAATLSAVQMLSLTC